MHQSTTFGQVLGRKRRLSISSWMSFSEPGGSDCVVFKTHDRLLTFYDKKRKHGFKKVGTFTCLCRPSPERFSWSSTFQRWIPILRTIRDNAATFLFDVLQNLKVRVRYTKAQRTRRIYRSGAGISYRSFVNAYAAFAVKKSREVAGIYFCYVE